MKEFVLNKLDRYEISLRLIKYAGGAVGVSAAFIEGYPIFATISLIIAGLASEALDFIKEKRI